MKSRLDSCFACMQEMRPREVYPRHREVLESFLAYYKQKGQLTPGQVGYFESFENRYSKRTLEENSRWCDNYDSDKRGVAVKCAHYYRANPPYFSDVAKSVLQDPHGHILTKRQYTKMCENKFAKKILAQYAATPKFKAGEFVRIRKRHKIQEANGFDNVITIGVADTPSVIITVDARPIMRHAKGARIYRILPVGSSRSILAHEADLKSARIKL